MVKQQRRVTFVELRKKACEVAVGWPSWEGSRWPCFTGSLKRPIEGFPFEEETLSFCDPDLLGRKHYFHANFYPNYIGPITWTNWVSLVAKVRGSQMCWEAACGNKEPWPHCLISPKPRRPDYLKYAMVGVGHVSACPASFE